MCKKTRNRGGAFFFKGMPYQMTAIRARHVGDCLQTIHDSICTEAAVVKRIHNVDGESLMKYDFAEFKLIKKSYRFCMHEFTCSRKISSISIDEKITQKSS